MADYKKGVVTKKTKEEKAEEIKQLIENAEDRINTYFESPENLKEYLNFMSKFYKYSPHNCSMIESQFPGAVAVASFTTWKKFGFHVKRNEKAIGILAPCFGKDRFKNAEGEIKLVKDATLEERKKLATGQYTIKKGCLYFRKESVFDISQTNATLDDIPKLFPNRWIEGDVSNYSTLLRAFEKIADSIGVNVIEPPEELGVIKGVSYTKSKNIALNPRNSELQNVKTYIHELTHAKLHTVENFDKYKTHEKEFQAELTAYVVCQYLGLDTSEYSIKYLHDWTKGKTLEDKKQLLDEIHKTATEFINIIEETLEQERTSKNMQHNETVDGAIENKKQSLAQRIESGIDKATEHNNRSILSQNRKELVQER